MKKKISLPHKRVQKESRFPLFDRDDTLDHSRSPARKNTGSNQYYRNLATLEGINMGSYQEFRPQQQQQNTLLERQDYENNPSVDTPSSLTFRFELSC